MNQSEPVLIVGVRFSNIGKNYFFNASHLNDIKSGDFVVVETSRGWQIGEVTEVINKIETSMKAGLKPVNRRATPLDLIKKQDLNLKQEEALVKCVKKQKQLNLRNVKFITAECSFDERSISFLYTTELEQIDRWEYFQNEIREVFPKIKVEFHKIGPRDVARYYGGMGACGLETRCCAKFLNEFQSISIKMAKIQGISLTPSDITGICDRLRCCLNYEFCQYEDAFRHLPKRNQLVSTPSGEGRVVDLLPLQGKVIVEFFEEGEKEFDVNEIKILERGASPQEEKQTSISSRSTTTPRENKN